jgi:DNA end-binding protein Ku
MPKSHWKGFISFGLVSIPIKLFPTENYSADISFHQIDKNDHARIHYQRINSNTGKKVKWEDIIKGYEYDPETIIPLPDKVLRKIAGEKNHELEIQEFINKAELDPVSLQRSYFVTPDKNGDKGYVILREALQDTDKMGIGKIIISTKEYIGAIAPYHQRSLILYLLKYDDELNKIEEFEIPNKNLSYYKVNKKEIDIAKQLISSMSNKWRPEKYINEYQAILHKWVDDEVNNKPHKSTKKYAPKASAKVIDFAELLKNSLIKKKSVLHTKSKHSHQKTAKTKKA